MKSAECQAKSRTEEDVDEIEIDQRELESGVNDEKDRNHSSLTTHTTKNGRPPST